MVSLQDLFLDHSKKVKTSVTRLSLAGDSAIQNYVKKIVDGYSRRLPALA